MTFFTRQTLIYLGQALIRNKPFRHPHCRNLRWNRPSFHTSALRYVVGAQINMPSLSPTMTEGKIIKWLKKEGDAVKPGDLLCEIQTDKAVMGFETEEEGILAKILVPENSDIKVGTLIALMVNEGEDWKSVEMPQGSSSSQSDSTIVTETAPKTEELLPGQVKGTPLKMPSLSPTMMEGTIIRWLKKEGETINPGDALCEVQTDKAVMVFETEDEGILAKILVPDNTAGVKVGSLIAIVVDEGEDWKNVAIPRTTSEEAPEPSSQTSSTTTSTGHAEIGQKIWPAVRNLLEHYRLDPKTISSTGRGGTLLKKDVLKFISDNNLQPKPPKEVPLPSSSRKESHSVDEQPPSLPRRRDAPYIDIEVSNVRQVIAKRLTESKTNIPHVYGAVDARIGDLLKARQGLKSGGINVSVNDFVIKAVGSALKECPRMNSLYINDQIVRLGDIDISIATATENGLITPIVRAVDMKDITQISEDVKILAGKARKGTLQLSEFQGGSFTISNLGMFGIREFSAIINPPQCGILAVGTGREELLADGRFESVMTSKLSFDGRAIDPVDAGEFLEALQYYLETPSLLLLSQTRNLEASAR